MEFCSDVFLLPLGMPAAVDSIDMDADAFVRDGSQHIQLPPDPPPRNLWHTQHQQTDETYYDLLVNKLEFNNNTYVENVLRMHDESRVWSTAACCKPRPPTRNVLAPLYESRELEQFI